MAEIKCGYCGKRPALYPPRKYMLKWCCEKDPNLCPDILEKVKNKRPKHYKNRSIFIENSINICDYGCNKIAKYKFRNGKFCCENSKNKCPGMKNKNSERNKESKIITVEIPNGKICDYGCNKIAKYKFRNGKFCCEKRYNDCTSFKEKHKISFTKIRNDPSSSYQIGSFRDKVRKHCLNGHAIAMIKAIKNPSKPEVMLRELIKELYQNCEFQYPVFNYSLDVALPEYKIAIEYDGYYHFDTEEHKEYHKLRQERIEGIGWRFIRYAFNLPGKETIKKDIKRILER
jgi:very-short-patch-repair endonuclease